MRKYTFAVSVTAHLAAVAALFIAPLFATELLPGIRDATEWIPVRAVSIPNPAPPSRASERQPITPAHVTTVPDVVPDHVPDGIPPETDGPPHDPGGFLGPGVPVGVGDGDERGRFVPSAPPPAAAPRSPVPVGGAVVPPRKIVHIAPIYPPLAIAAKREGRVILEAVIAENGEVRTVKVLSSVHLLDQAAIDAVRQWRFTPTMLNGEPVPVIMSVTVFFRLN